MSAGAMQVQQSTIREYIKQLHLPTVGGQFLKLAEEAIRQKQGHLAFLEVLLRTELEERERNAIARRIREAKFPKVKLLEEFHFEEPPTSQRRCYGIWRKAATWSAASRSFFWATPARGKRTWLRGWLWRPAANANA
jgi:DNA replication protein DnaC